MSMRFIVLASGSRGNSSYVEAEGFGVLLDAGLLPKKLENCLALFDLGWQQVKAVLLTHTHRDHWNDRTLGLLCEMEIPLYCHAQHHSVLLEHSSAFADMCARNLVLAYEVREQFKLAPRFSCLPFRVHHDGGLTCGFRLEGPPDMFGVAPALAYVSDLGSWDSTLPTLLANADVLALEFNHDVEMQRTSRRSQPTIARNLGDNGHLSNVQAAELTGEVLRKSHYNSVQHIVQLHLSQECNRPELAVEALQEPLSTIRHSVQIHTANQDQPGPCLVFGEVENANRSSVRRGRVQGNRTSVAESLFTQTHLPGWE